MKRLMGLVYHCLLYHCFKRCIGIHNRETVIPFCHAHPMRLCGLRMSIKLLHYVSHTAFKILERSLLTIWQNAFSLLQAATLTQKE